VNVLHQPPTTKPELTQRFVLYDVGWEGYEKILAVIGKRPIRVTYDRGNLEFLSPFLAQEIYKEFFCRLFVVLAEELDIPLKACGSTTFRRQDLDRGLEPDECFYLASAARVSGWRIIDLSTYPPPDLAVEVDITASSLNRMGIYAALGVPELWRFDGTSLEVYRLVAGAYQPCAQSPNLPFLPLGGLLPLVQQSITAADDREVLRSLRAWVRGQVVPAYRAFVGSGDSPGSGVLNP